MSKAKALIIFALLIGGVLLMSCSNPNEEEGGSSSSAVTGKRSSSSGAGTQSSSSTNTSSSSYNSGGSSSSGNGEGDSSSSGGEGGDESSSSFDDDESSSSGDSDESSSSYDDGDSSSSSIAIRSSSSRASSQSSSSIADLPSSSSSVAAAGEFTDSRDSKKYKTVVIGTQTWMAENLNYEPSSANGIHKCYAEGYGWDTWLKPTDDQAKIKANCDKYGRLYDWVTATSLPASCVGTSCGSQVKAKHQGICPSGWHLPSRDEWNKLKDYVFDILWNNYEDEDFGWGVGTKLKATSGWKEHSEHGNGVDTYGFNAIGSGYCYNCTQEGLNSATGSYSGISERGDGKGEFAYWWSATEYVNQNTKEAKNAWRFTASYNSNEFIEKNEYRSDLYSIRCVKD